MPGGEPLCRRAAGEILDSSPRPSGSAQRALRIAAIPAEVTTDRAAAYPRVPGELIPGAARRGAVREQPDQGRPRAADSPAPADAGLKRHRSARILAAGHAFAHNLRRGRYDIGAEVADHHWLRTAFDDLVTTI